MKTTGATKKNAGPSGGGCNEGREDSQDRASHREKKDGFASHHSQNGSVEVQQKAVFCDVHILACYLNITPRRVQQLVRYGVLPKGTKRGEYDLIPCIHSYQVHLKRVLNRFASSYAGHCRGGRHNTKIKPENKKVVRRIYNKPGAPPETITPPDRQPTLFDSGEDKELCEGGHEAGNTRHQGRTALNPYQDTDRMEISVQEPATAARPVTLGPDR